MKKTVLFVYSIFYLYPAFSQAPSPVACYNFSGNLNEANGGPSLTPINGLGTFTKGLSLCAWIDPSPTDSFYNWVVDQGLDLSIGTTFPKNNYTIELLFKFTSSPYQRSWQRIIDFKNNTTDLGLYTFQAGTNYNLQMYTINTGTTNMATPNTWLRLFVTRDSLTGVMNGYINDSLQISFTDNTNGGVFNSDLILFKDDIVVPNEESAGTIDYLRIYDKPLTKAQISYIVNASEPAISISGNTNICKGDSTVLVATGASIYLWSNGATTDSIIVRDTLTTFYSVTAWNYLFCARSCKTVDTLTVYVNSCSGVPPVANFNSSDTAFCDESGKCIDFTDHSTGNPTSWRWIFTGATPDTSTQQNPTRICYNYPGTYTVSLIVSNSNGYDTLTITPLIIFSVAPPPPVVKASGDTLICTPGFSYQWYFNGSPIAGATDSFYVAGQSGTYAAQITDSIGCSSLSNGVYVSINSLKEISTIEGIKIYPNPSQGTFFVYFNDMRATEGLIKIYNVFCEEIYNERFSAVDKKELDLKISKGIYSLQLVLYPNTGRETRYIKKILVQ